MAKKTTEYSDTFIGRNAERGQTGQLKRLGLKIRETVVDQYGIVWHANCQQLRRLRMQYRFVNSEKIFIIPSLFKIHR